jgi:predicted nucleic-acid-binding protein
VQAFDTNVLVRLALGDDAAQAAPAAGYWREALGAGGIVLPVVVLVELVWVLDRVAQLDRPRIHSELMRLTNLEGIVVENSTVVSAAVRLYAASRADFADCVILESARAAQALPVHSFDRRFARIADVSLLADREP